MKNNIFKRGYRSVCFLGGSDVDLSDCQQVLNINASCFELFTRQEFFLRMLDDRLSRQADLLIIEADSFGVDDTGFILSMANVFLSELPIVIVTRNELSEARRSRYLQSRLVLDVMRLDDSCVSL